MRARAAVALLALLVALIPCATPPACASATAARSCCSAGGRCDCSAGAGSSPAPEPASAAASPAPAQPADLSVAAAVEGRADSATSGADRILLAHAEATAPSYLSACSFRC